MSGRQSVVEITNKDDAIAFIVDGGQELDEIRIELLAWIGGANAAGA